MVAACSGLDVFCHALESLTALPYDRRPAPEDPDHRPAYQGSNPISDVWAARAAQMGAANLRRVLEDPDDEEARGAMLLAATFAGIGFANAGTHLAHAMSYPVSGMVRDYRRRGLPVRRTPWSRTACRWRSTRRPCSASRPRRSRSATATRPG